MCFFLFVFFLVGGSVLFLVCFCVWCLVLLISCRCLVVYACLSFTFSVMSFIMILGDSLLFHVSLCEDGRTSRFLNCFFQLN